MSISHELFIATFFGTLDSIDVNIFRTEIAFKTTVPFGIYVISCEYRIAPTVGNGHHVIRILALRHRKKIIVPVVLVRCKTIRDHHFTLTDL